jgi:hypothetical protein
MATAATNRLLTLGQAADRLEVQLWMAQRVIDRRLVPAPPKVGRNRVLTEADWPALRSALTIAGYLPRDVGDMT